MITFWDILHSSILSYCTLFSVSLIVDTLSDKDFTCICRMSSFHTLTWWQTTLLDLKDFFSSWTTIFIYIEEPEPYRNIETSATAVSVPVLYCCFPQMLSLLLVLLCASLCSSSSDSSQQQIETLTDNGWYLLVSLQNIPLPFHSSLHLTCNKCWLSICCVCLCVCVSCLWINQFWSWGCLMKKAAWCSSLWPVEKLIRTSPWPGRRTVKQLLLIEPPLTLPVLPLNIPLNIQMLRYVTKRHVTIWRYDVTIRQDTKYYEYDVMTWWWWW